MSKHLVPWKRSVKGYKTGCQKVKHRLGPIKAGLTCLLSLSRRCHSSWGYPLDPAEAGPQQFLSPLLSKSSSGDTQSEYTCVCVCVCVCSVVSESLQPGGLQPTRFLCPWDFPQEYRSGLPLPTPGDLPYPGMEPMSLASPALAGGFSTTSTTELYIYSFNFHPPTPACLACGILGPPTRDGTCIPGIGSVESYLRDHQGSPNCTFKNH